MKLHHIAYVCKDVNEKARSLSKLTGCRVICGPVVDEYQGVKILFVQFSDGTKLELLEPLNDKSPVRRFLQTGGGLYHLCFEVDNLNHALEQITKDGSAIVVRPPAPAPAIDNRRVAFVVTEQKDIIELVE